MEYKVELWVDIARKGEYREAELCRVLSIPFVPFIGMTLEFDDSNENPLPVKVRGVRWNHNKKCFICESEESAVFTQEALMKRGFLDVCASLPQEVA